jgi:hypothetical protein
MATQTPTPDEAHAAALAAGALSSAAKWLAGIFASLIVTAFVAVFGWIWRTDRAVAAMAAAEEQDRASRQQWRAELIEWLKNIESRVNAGEISQAEQRGRESGRKERHDQ